MNENAFVVESIVKSEEGDPQPARVYVGTKERAEEIVAQGAANNVVRTWREIPLSDMPLFARDNLLRARAEQPTG